MTLRRKPPRRRARLTLLALIAGLAVLAPAHADPPPQQTITSSGPLTNITVSDDLACQVKHKDDDGPAFFPQTSPSDAPVAIGASAGEAPLVDSPGDCATIVVTGGVTYGPDFSSHPDSNTSALGPVVPYTPVSQALSGDGSDANPYEVTTVVDLPGSTISVTEIDKYIVGNDYYRTYIELNDSSPYTNYAYVVHAGDCFLGDSNSGYGLFDPGDGTETAGCAEVADGTAGRVLTMAGVGDDDAEEGLTSDIWGNIPSEGGLGDGCDCSTNQDNAVGVGWFVTLGYGGGDSGSIDLDVTTTITGVPNDVHNLNLTVDEKTIPAAGEQIPLSTIPPGALAGIVDAPGANPLSSVPLASIPLASIPLASIPLSSIPLASIGLEDATMNPNALDQILLSQIPIDWKTVLAGTSLSGLEERTLSLKRVFDNAAARANYLSVTQSVPITAAGFGRSLLRGGQLFSVLLGRAKLNQLPPPGAGSWCASLQAADPSFDCTGMDESQTTVLGLDIAGAPLASIPLASIPLASIPLASIPLASIPLASIAIDATPLASIPLASIPNVNNVVDCSQVDCVNGTLGDAAQAGAIRPGARLPDLGPALGQITFGEVLIGILLKSDFPWEKIPLANILEVAQGPSVGYHLSWDLTCVDPLDLTMKVTIPNGFRYVPDSSKFTYGGGAAINGADPVVSGSTLTWTSYPGTPCPAPLMGSNQHFSLGFRARSGVELGDFKSDGTVIENGGSPVDVLQTANVHVTETLEPNDDPATAPIISPDTLIVSHISSSSDVDYFRVSAGAARSKWKFLLSHIAPTKDFDLVVYGEQGQPLQSAPLSSIPLSSIPMEDEGSDYQQGKSESAETLKDVPLASIPLASISAKRGDENETAKGTSKGSGFFTIQVTGYNGSHSTTPYVLRVQQKDPPPLPPAPPRTFAFDADPYGGADEAQTTGTLPTTVLPTTQTLFIVDQDRMSDLYGAGPTNQMMTQLNLVAARPEVLGAVLPVDGNPAVVEAMKKADSDPNSIDFSNDVVRKINDVVNIYRTSLPQLKYMVLVGGDEALPFMRVFDGVSLSNEEDEAADLAFTTAGLTKSNAAYGAAAQGMILTNDAYVAFTRTEWFGRELFLPDIAAGRLVETPEQISAELRRYVQSGGRIDPTTALVTGYDFLTDGAQAEDGSLSAQFGNANMKRLISDTWTRSDLLNEFFTPATPVGVAAINAHYNHYQLQPAVAPNGSGLVSTGDVPPPPASPIEAPKYVNRLLFTVGCHSGYTLSNTIMPGSTDPRLRDWPEAWAGQQLSAYLANTGFGYGDTQSVALSERLMALFTGKLSDASTTLGEKFVEAKHLYFKSAGAYGPYDEKVLIEASFFGLPFYRIGAAGPGPTPPVPPVTAPDPITGLETATIAVTPVTTRVDVPRGSFWNGPNGTHNMFYRPVQPTVTQNIDVPGKNAHGVILSALTTLDVPGVNPVIAAPTIDLSSHEPEPGFQDTIYPATFANMSRSRSFGAVHATFNLIAGQFRPDEPAGITGTQRLVTAATAKISYSPSNDYVSPNISELHVTTLTPTSARIFARASDGGQGVKRFTALVKHSTTGVWDFVELSHVGDHWTADILTGGAADKVEVSGQASDYNGNSSFDANKGRLHPAKIDTEGPDIIIDSPVDGATYSKNQDVKAKYSCSDGGSGVLTCSGPVPNGTSIDTSVIGLHTFTVQASDSAGNTSSKTVTFFVIDGPPPPPGDDFATRTIFTHETDILFAPPLGNDSVPGETTDDRSGVDSVTVTFTPLIPLFGTRVVRFATLTCTADRRKCTWMVEVPSDIGRYAVQAQGRDLSGNIESPGAQRTIWVL